MIEKILFVDDEIDIELLAKQKFRKQISAGVFNLLFSHNGLDALELVQSDPHIAIVVLDLNMPGMDGMTLLDKLKEFDPSIKTIVVSAYSDSKTIRTAMNKEAFDFVTKPVDFEDLADVLMRALFLYRSFSTPLRIYQEKLKPAFPEGFELTSLPHEKYLLWDAFLLNPLLVKMIGIAIPPSSSLPIDLVLGSVYGILRAELQEKGPLHLKEIEKTIYGMIPSLSANLIIGQYHKDTHKFFYETTGGFIVQHKQADAELVLPPSKIIDLAREDMITINHPLSSSKFSISPAYGQEG